MKVLPPPARCGKRPVTSSFGRETLRTARSPHSWVARRWRPWTHVWVALSAVHTIVTVRCAFTATCGSEAFWSVGETAVASDQVPVGVRSLVKTRSPSGSASTQAAVARPSASTATFGSLALPSSVDSLVDGLQLPWPTGRVAACTTSPFSPWLSQTAVALPAGSMVASGDVTGSPEETAAAGMPWGRQSAAVAVVPVGTTSAPATASAIRPAPTTPFRAAERVRVTVGGGMCTPPGD